MHVLFCFLKINAEFIRITTVPLQPRLLASLDKHHSKLIEIIRNKGGAVREKTCDILKVLNHVCSRQVYQNLMSITQIVPLLIDAIVIILRTLHCKKLKAFRNCNYWNSKCPFVHYVKVTSLVTLKNWTAYLYIMCMFVV